RRGSRRRRRRCWRRGRCWRYRGEITGHVSGWRAAARRVRRRLRPAAGRLVGLAIRRLVGLAVRRLLRSGRGRGRRRWPLVTSVRTGRERLGRRVPRQRLRVRRVTGRVGVAVFGLRLAEGDVIAALGGQLGQLAVSPVADVVEAGAGLLLELGLRNRVPAFAAVLQTEQTEAHPGQAGPDPPTTTGLVQL